MVGMQCPVYSILDTFVPGWVGGRCGYVCFLYVNLSLACVGKGRRQETAIILHENLPIFSRHAVHQNTSFVPFTLLCKIKQK